MLFRARNPDPFPQTSIFRGVETEPDMYVLQTTVSGATLIGTTESSLPFALCRARVLLA